jgi:hypothetical protein
MSEELVFNGIDATTGEYLIPPVQAGTMAAAISGEPRNAEEAEALKLWWQKYAETNLNKQDHYIAKEGTNYKDLASAGWGVIFPYNVDAAILKALKPLLDWRKSQAGKLYREYTGPEGYRFKPGEMYESKDEWLSRHDAGPGPVDPEIVPYYLLIVGDPEHIASRRSWMCSTPSDASSLTSSKIIGITPTASSAPRGRTWPSAGLPPSSVRRTRMMLPPT